MGVAVLVENAKQVSTVIPTGNVPACHNVMIGNAVMMAVGEPAEYVPKRVRFVWK